MSRSRLVLTALAAMLLAVPSLAQDAVTPHYINIPGTDTKLKFYGFVQVYAEEYFNQPEYDNGAIIDGYSSHTYAAMPHNAFSLTARTSRFGFATITPSAEFGDVTTKIELDFAHATTDTNPSPSSNPAGNFSNSFGLIQSSNGQPRLRQAVIGIGNWTVGYTWSNWLDLDAGAETLDWNGPLGQACDDTPRITQIRCTVPFDKNNSLAISLEANMNQEGYFYSGNVVNPANAAQAAAVTTPNQKLPTVVGAYTYSDKWGHVALRGMGIYYSSYTSATPTAGALTLSTWAPAVQVSGDVKFGGDDLVGSVYYGKGMGSYGTDNGYDELYDLGNQTINLTKSIGWQVGYTHHFTSKVRANVFASGLNYSDDADVPNFALYNGPGADPTTLGDVKNAQFYGANVITKLTKSVELGAEYVYESITTQGANAVIQQDLSTTNKLSSNKIQVTLTASF